ncbi:MAG: ribosome assembly RNA-binding protein YhbY [Myxococcota bacterium]|nr:ribosome assembly RNA-binding protein YhbY [Myxococcota bacterium]
MPASPPALAGVQKRHLRALAHPLQPVVQVGKEGISPGVVSATDQALTDHELIKVRLPQVEKDERDAMAEKLGEATKAQLAGITGRIALLYRRHPEKPKIRLPRA